MKRMVQIWAKVQDHAHRVSAASHQHVERWMKRKAARKHWKPPLQKRAENRQVKYPARCTYHLMACAFRQPSVKVRQLTSRRRSSGRGNLESPGRSKRRTSRTRNTHSPSAPPPRDP
eukprot:6204901-Pleurochrysis_carterae.AAC.4